MMAYGGNVYAAAILVRDRQARMLRTAMGPTILAALADPDVIEILANPDGSLWVDTLSAGRKATGVSLKAPEAERLIRLVAAQVQKEVHAGAPILSTHLPFTGERFEGVLPPVVRAPSFAIRKHARAVFSLEDYIAQGVLTEDQCRLLSDAVASRRNIVIAGAASSGKTTLANALLREIALTGDRVVLLEDTVELQCVADDHLCLCTGEGVTLRQLLRTTLRLRPDRIVVGEVRGPEALDLIKAWGTGHPGGLATLHAGSAREALLRLEQLIQEAVISIPRALIADAVNLIVVLTGRGTFRRVQEIVRVDGWVDGDYTLASLTSL